MALTKSEITDLRDLARTSSIRYERGQVLVEGFRAISGALRAGAKFVSVILSEAKDLELDTLDNDIIVEVDQKTIDKIATTTSPQGAIAICEMLTVSPETFTNDLANKPIFILDHVSDPGNVGTIIRSSVAFEIAAVVSYGGCDVFHPKVVRSSAGTIFGLTAYAAQEYELGAIIGKRPKYCADLDGAQSLNQISFVKNAAIVLGSEAHGIITPELSKNAEKFTIHMAELCESLNVAMTATLIAHHISGA